MAYMNQERKAAKAPAIKAVCKKYGIKASVAVRHHSTLVLNIKSGEIDFIGNFNQIANNRQTHEWFQPAKGYIDVSPYWYRDHFTGKAVEFLEEVLAAMNEGNHNRSDLMTDYHDVGWYVDVSVGQWNKPYEFTGDEA